MTALQPGRAGPNTNTFVGKQSATWATCKTREILHGKPSSIAALSLRRLTKVFCLHRLPVLAVGQYFSKYLHSYIVAQFTPQTRVQRMYLRALQTGRPRQERGRRPVSSGRKHYSSDQHVCRCRGLPFHFQWPPHVRLPGLSQD